MPSLEFPAAARHIPSPAVVFGPGGLRYAPKLSGAQTLAVREAVSKCSSAYDKDDQGKVNYFLWGSLKAHYGYPTYRDMQSSLFDEAYKYLHFVPVDPEVAILPAFEDASAATGTKCRYL